MRMKDALLELAGELPVAKEKGREEVKKVTKSAGIKINFKMKQ
jgi:hypothetical protein